MSVEEFPNELEDVLTLGDLEIKRHRVPAGWMYIITNTASDVTTASFTPDPTGAWVLEA